MSVGRFLLEALSENLFYASQVLVCWQSLAFLGLETHRSNLCLHLCMASSCVCVCLSVCLHLCLCVQISLSFLL